MRIAFALSLLGLVGCHSLRDRIARCDDSEIRRDVSPDGRHDAVLFVRDCNDGKATTEVSVVGHEETVYGEGNALNGDPKHPGTLFVPVWKSATELAIEQPWVPGGISLGSSDTASGVRITVVEPTPPPPIR